MLEGIVLTYGILAVISLISPMLHESSLIKEIDGSLLCKTMYENNILLKIIL